MRKTIFSITSILMAGLAGCGYTTASFLARDLNSIHVANFANRIDPTREISDRRMSYGYRPGLENQITRAVIDRFMFDRYLDVKSEAAAVLTLRGELTDLRQSALSYDKAGNVEELRVQILVDLELYDNRTGELLWKENDFMGWSSYHLAGPHTRTEAEGIRAAVEDLSARISERVVEDW